jgi:hypothetical protein
MPPREIILNGADGPVPICAIERMFTMVVGAALHL